MARTFYNKSNVTAYLLVYTMTTTDSTDISQVIEIPANGSYDIANLDETYQTSTYTSFIAVKDNSYNSFGYVANTSTSYTPTFSYTACRMGICTTYNNETYYTSSQNFNLTAASHIYFSFSNDTSASNVIDGLNVTNATLKFTRPFVSKTWDVYALYDIEYTSNIGDLTLTITPNTGYMFSSYEIDVYITANGTRYGFIFSDNSGTTDSVSQTVRITGTPITHAEVTNGENTGMSGRGTVQISGSHMVNATFDYTPTDNLYTGDTVNITITANTGYIFSSDDLPYVSVTSGGIYEDTANFTLSDDLSVGTLSYTPPTTWSKVISILISIEATATLKPDVPTTSYSFVNIFALDETQLSEIAKYRFYVADENSPVNLVDLGYYVSSLKRFYCDIPVNEDVSQNVVLGNIDTGVSCSLVSGDFITLNCGNVTIESTNENENDYQNTVYIILPFCGQQTLDSNLIMNRTINVAYSVSIISGECVITITDVDTSVVLYTFTGNISENVPYIINNILWELKGNFDNPSSVLYGFIPKLVIVYHENYNSTGLYNDSKYGVVSDIATNLCMIDDVIMMSNGLTDDEYNNIITELHNGVIFD